MTNIRNLMYLAVFIMSLMLFSGNYTDGSSRVIQALWNTGHVVFFMCFNWILITQTRLSRYSLLKILLISIAVTTFFGAVIEVIQHYTGRDMSYGDLVKDIVGGLAGFIIALYSVQDLKNKFVKSYKYYIQAFGVVLLGVIVWPVLKLVYDDYRMEVDFPEISSFESPIELSRWYFENIVEFKRSKVVTYQSEDSLYVKFGIAEYPKISLEHMITDWSKYAYLKFSVHNNQENMMNLQLKIIDRAHRTNNYVFNDRFNRELSLKPGWNHYTVPLSDIKNAPSNREMDMTSIIGLSFFIVEPDSQRSIYLNRIYLTN